MADESKLKIESGQTKEQPRPAGAPSPSSTRYVLALLHGHRAGPTPKSGESINTTFLHSLREHLEKIDAPPEKTEIDIWLDSGGGSIHAAYRLLRFLRSRCRRLRVVIPDSVQTAATLFAVAADELFMPPDAAVGPLDSLLMAPGSSGGAISCLEIVRAHGATIAPALPPLVRQIDDIMDSANISRGKALDLITAYAAQTLRTPLADIDSRLVATAESYLAAAETYCRRLLEGKLETSFIDNDNFNDSLEDNEPALSTRLTRGFPSHHYAICPDELEEMGVTVRELNAYPYRSELLYLYNMHFKSRRPINMVLESGELADLRKRL